MNGNKGFTLLELVISIGILAVLAITGAVTFTSQQRNTRDAQRRDSINEIKTALELYKLNSNTRSYIPGASLTPLVPTYLKAIPKDPATNAPLIYTYTPTCELIGGVNYCDSYTLTIRLESGQLFQSTPERGLVVTPTPP